MAQKYVAALSGWTSVREAARDFRSGLRTLASEALGLFTDLRLYSRDVAFWEVLSTRLDQ
jgi:hypothetical protein